MTGSDHAALVVDDDRSWRQIIGEILTDLGLEVDTADNLEDAVRLIKARSHRVAVVDLSLSPRDHSDTGGLHVLDAVRLADPNCRAILLTGFATVEVAVSAMADHNAFTFLRKESFQTSQFRDVISKALAGPPPAAAGLPGPGPSHPGPQAAPAAAPSLAGYALVVEDDAGWRNILEELLIDLGLRVRACASFGDALGCLRRETFNLAVVDLSLDGSVSGYWRPPAPTQDLEGYQLLASIRAGGMPAVVVSGVAAPGEIEKAFAEQSIFAYLEKQAFDRAAFRRVVGEALAVRREESELDALTGREREVLDLLARGLTNKEIAEQLVITTNTVKRHLKAIFEKLDVHTRSAAAARAAGEKG